MNDRISFLAAALSCTALTVALTGCGLGVSGDAAKSTTSSASHLIGGNLHGGQQPVSGATVQLWAAGVTGTTAASYGANATVVAATTSDGAGNFGFDVNGTSPCTIGQYLYITATGGNSGSGTNSSLAMMAALPNPCSTTTGQQFVNINELTTVASVYALQQFMTIAPGASPAWKIGAPSTNVTGLANAFLTVSSMVNVANGTTATSSTSNAVTSTVGGVLYTTIVNPDYTKINTLGDILAYCVNSNGAACSTLFADVTPSGSTTPTDTIQAAYYLATNAAGLTMPVHGAAAGSPNYLCNTYVSASAPFQPTIACSSSTVSSSTAMSVPSDWMIGVNLKTTNASAVTVITTTAGSIGIDASGNVWTAADNSSATGGSVGALNVIGQVVVAPVTTTNISTNAGFYGSSYTGTTTAQPFGGSRPNSLALDTNGNAWVGPYYSTPYLITANANGTNATTTGTNEAPVVQVTPTGASTGYLTGSSPGALVVDGNNNVFFSNITNLNATSGSGTGRYYVSELMAAGTPAYSTYYTGTGRSTNIYGTLAVDDSSSQYISPFLSSSCGTSDIRTDNAVAMQNGQANATTNAGASTITLATGGTTTCIQNGAATDVRANIWGTNATYLEYVDVVNGSLTAPVVSQFTAGSGTTPGTGGLETPQGVAIDGLGNVWVANNGSYSVTVGTVTTKYPVTGITEFTPTTTATSTTVVAKSPTGATTAGFGAANALSGPAALAIDPSGNLWVATTGGSYLNFFVGAAAPVVTPYSLAIKNAAIGVRP